MIHVAESDFHHLGYIIYHKYKRRTNWWKNQAKIDMDVVGFLRGGCSRGGGNWGTLGIPKKRLGKIRGITTPPLRILLGYRKRHGLERANPFLYRTIWQDLYQVSWVQSFLSGRTHIKQIFHRRKGYCKSALQEHPNVFSKLWVMIRDSKKR